MTVAGHYLALPVSTRASPREEMAPVMVLIALNLAAGSFAATVYALISLRWVRRGSKALAALNALVAAGGVAVALGYAWLLWNDAAPRPGLPLLGLVLLLPAVTRFIELQREERRDAYARHLGDSLRKIDDDPSVTEEVTTWARELREKDR